MRDILGKVGLFLALIGILSTVLYFFDMNLRILRPINDMDPGPAWGVRIGFIVVGIVLFFVSSKGDDDKDSSKGDDAKD